MFGIPNESALKSLAKGVTVEGVRYGPIEAGVDARKGDNTWLTVSLREGRNREIRRVMVHLRLSVSRLIRVAYGPFQLGTLERGGIEEIPCPRPAGNNSPPPPVPRHRCIATSRPPCPKPPLRLAERGGAMTMKRGQDGGGRFPARWKTPYVE